MHYEVYLDSLFLLNFGMNLCVLLLVDQSTYHTATWYRLLLGAGVGAGCYLLPFFGGGIVSLLLSGVGGMLLMLWVTFRIRSLSALWCYIRRLFGDTFLLGGILLALLRTIPGTGRYLPGVCTVLGLGALACLGICRSRKQACETRGCHRVRIVGESGEQILSAVLDTGNTLTEPISGAPVSVIQEAYFRELWSAEPPGLRVIPYHSIGRKRGILRAYPVPELWIETDGIWKRCENVYLAVSGEELAGEEIALLLHPALLNG